MSALYPLPGLVALGRKPINLCLLCLCLLAGCKTVPVDTPMFPPQPIKRGPVARAFFRHLHYPYIASRARQRLIERAARGDLHPDNEAQLLAQLGPPDWKGEVDGYPPRIPPAQIWYYIHTWRRPVGLHYQGKMILFEVNMDDHSVGSMQEYGFQRINH